MSGDTLKSSGRPRYARGATDMLEDTSLSRDARLLWVMIEKFDNGETRPFPSRELLAKLMGCQVRAIGNWLAELSDAGWIVIHSRPGRSNEYELCWQQQKPGKKRAKTRPRHDGAYVDNHEPRHDGARHPGTVVPDHPGTVVPTNKNHVNKNQGRSEQPVTETGETPKGARRNSKMRRMGAEQRSLLANTHRGEWTEFGNRMGDLFLELDGRGHTRADVLDWDAHCKPFVIAAKRDANKAAGFPKFEQRFHELWQDRLRTTMEYTNRNGEQYWRDKSPTTWEWANNWHGVGGLKGMRRDYDATVAKRERDNQGGGDFMVDFERRYLAELGGVVEVDETGRPDAIEVHES